ncbi:unnamed protein product, partial [Nesidiocoris tenuis]
MTDDRIEAVKRLRHLAEELYLLEACCHPKNETHLGEKRSRSPIDRGRQPTKFLRSKECSKSPPNRDSECYALRCQIPRCRSNPGAEPIITWVPVREVRKTSIAERKVEELNRQNPLTNYETTEKSRNCFRRTSSTQDSPFEKFCSNLKSFQLCRKPSRENLLQDAQSSDHSLGRKSECDSDPGWRVCSGKKASKGKRSAESMFYVIPASPPHSPVRVCLTRESSSGRTKSPTKYRAALDPRKEDALQKCLDDIYLCCPPKGPLMDSHGKPYSCQVTLDGRQVCKPQSNMDKLVYCTKDDAKVFPKCYGKTRLFTRAKVLNQKKVEKKHIWFCAEFDNVNDFRDLAEFRTFLSFVEQKTARYKYIMYEGIKKRHWNPSER